MTTERKNLTISARTAVLTESGYRCAVPTCRGILAIDLHHIIALHWRIAGGDELYNLIALCQTCHALFHRGTIPLDAVKSWKAMLVALSNAFDKEAMDDLLFLSRPKEEEPELPISADGVLKFSRLIAAGLVGFKLYRKREGFNRRYEVALTDKGRSFVDAWKKGDRELLAKSWVQPSLGEPK